jgi:hypothetical protein
MLKAEFYQNDSSDRVPTQKALGLEVKLQYHKNKPPKPQLINITVFKHTNIAGLFPTF